MPEASLSPSSPSLMAESLQRPVVIGSVELLEGIVELLDAAARAAASAGREALAASHRWAALEVHFLH